MKAVILDAPVETAGVADRDVLLCSVEDMCHPGTLEVAHVQDRLAVPNDDPGTDLRMPVSGYEVQPQVGTLLQEICLFFSCRSPLPDSEPSLRCPLARWW